MNQELDEDEDVKRISCAKDLGDHLLAGRSFQKWKAGIGGGWL